MKFFWLGILCEARVSFPNLRTLHSSLKCFCITLYGRFLIHWPFASAACAHCFSRPANIADRSISEVVEAKPIRKGLNAFRDSFSSLCQDLGVPERLESLDRIGKEGKLAALSMGCS